jgi:hypothetical protein
VGPDGIPEVRDLQAHLGEPGSGHDAALKLILSGVLDLVSREARGAYLGAAAEKTVIFSGGEGRAHRLADSPASFPRGRLLLYLPHQPAPEAAGGNPVTLVEVRDSTGGEWRALAATDWTLEGRLLRRADGSEWPPFQGSVRVIYRAGYDAVSPMPGAVALGVLDGAAAEWRQRVRANPGLEILEPGSSPSMPKTFWKAVDAVRPPPEGF